MILGNSDEPQRDRHADNRDAERELKAEEFKGCFFAGNVEKKSPQEPIGSPPSFKTRGKR